ncbi:MAG: Twitching mobility protein [Firmicutes bacterium ADurb.Bin182]|nr:MAG: Twitching mobility protein [Firmicutes bacterium ADurb.Bin182]
MDIAQVLKNASELGISEVFIAPGFELSFKNAGELLPQGGSKLSAMDTEEIARHVYMLAGDRSFDKFNACGDDDFSFSLPGIGRFRVSVFRQRGSISMVIRVARLTLPDFEHLNIPKSVIDLYLLNKGLVLITGPAGSGKSTTLSFIVDKINRTMPYHIITIEDPIEYLYSNDKSIVTQREVNQDTTDIATAVKYAAGQSPNVLLISSLNDYKTISSAMEAAEAGQLVLSTMHTIGAANTIDRIIDEFPPARQQKIRVQLSMTLQAVVSQQLIPALNGGMVPAFEIMISNGMVRSLIREGKVDQINNVIYSNPEMNMITMDSSIYRLYSKGMISADNAVDYSTDAEVMRKRVKIEQAPPEPPGDAK